MGDKAVTVSEISIPAPVWGRAGGRTGRRRGGAYFNSRPRVGAGLPADVVRYRQRISIHAPVWGRGPTSPAVSDMLSISIHAPVWGRASIRRYGAPSRSLFQFTPPCGGGPRLCPGTALSAHFNSRPVWGRAEHYAPAALARPISIHAPVWGRTTKERRTGAWLTRFQFTPPCGGGGYAQRRRGQHRDISIHAPVWGRAHIRRRAPQRQRISIHAPVWGRAGSSAACRTRTSQFQFTPPCGGGRGTFCVLSSL